MRVNASSGPPSGCVIPAADDLLAEGLDTVRLAFPDTGGDFSAGGPPGAWDRDSSALHLALPGRVPAEPGHAGPPGGEHVKVRFIGPAEHAGEGTAIEGDGCERLATFGYPHAVLVRHVGVSGRSLGIEADSVWGGVAQVGPHPTTGQADIGTDGGRREKVKTQRQRLVPHHQLEDTGVVNGDNLAGDPVAEPQAATVPWRRLHQTQSSAKYVHVAIPSSFGCEPRISPPSLTVQHVTPEMIASRLRHRGGLFLAARQDHP